MEFSANAKINLGLFIKSKRPDGYHEIESVFLPIGWYDQLSFEESDSTQFSSSGIEIPSDPKGNLVLQAYQLLANDFDLPPLKIHLDKQVPIGAGLGGGSADASFMLKALNEKYTLGLSIEQLERYALQLGSDCPFFIQNKVVVASGIGEVLSPIEPSLQSNIEILVVVPPLHINTAQAYSLIKPKADRRPLLKLVKEPIENWQGNIINDFEDVLCNKYSILNDLRRFLFELGAQYVSMSGSGSAFYAFFAKSIPDHQLPKGYNFRKLQLTI